MNFIQRTIARAGLAWLNKRLEGTPMKGWKTWAGGLILILPGLAEVLVGASMIVSEVVNGTFNMDQGMGHIKTGSLGIGAGLAAIGLGHKLEKTKVSP